MPAFRPVTFGDTGLSVCPLGLGSSYGVDTADVERAFERGVNLFLWGSIRRSGFGRALRNLARTRRDRMVIAIQTYTRVASLMSLSTSSALRRLGIDHVDLLTLSWWNELPPPRIVEAALRLRDSGKVRHIMVSCHNRPTFARYIDDPAFAALMVRYNAAHTGAEREVFPHLVRRAPGVLAFTATRWGSLLDPSFNAPGEPPVRASDCYRFVLSNPAVHACLSGPKNGAELDEAMVALERGPMDEQELARMRRVGEQVRASAGAATVDRLDRLTGSRETEAR